MRERERGLYSRRPCPWHGQARISLAASRWNRQNPPKSPIFHSAHLSEFGVCPFTLADRGRASVVVSRSYEGVCHCRAIGFIYRTALAPEEWRVRACQCTFCRIHAALSTSDPRGSLRFVERVPAALNRYAFGRKTADFFVCRSCGAYIGATMWSGSKGFGIVNVRALHSLVDRLPEAQPMIYDDEGLAERLARRESRWTPIAVGEQPVAADGDG
jgi:hypothetical protein